MIAPIQQRPQFAIGQLVQHRRYGYRGVIVAFDASCAASDEWYFRNQTQPDRAQAWYHVLVHDQETVTYAAQTSLQPDASDLPIRHPWVGRYFDDFRNGRYIRNSKSFP